MLGEGRSASIGEMAAAKRIGRGYLGTLLRLTLLRPDIVEAIVNGSQAEGTTRLALTEPFPITWAEQPSAVQPH